MFPELIVDGLDILIEIESFEAHEAINDLFRVELVVRLDQTRAHLFGQEHLAHWASFSLELKDEARFQGIITSIRSLGLDRDHANRARYRVVIEPRLKLAAHTTTSRIFQDLSTKEIVDVVLKRHGVNTSWRLDRNSPARTYCVQYQESDLDFVQRLLAEDGIFFWFDSRLEERDTNREVVILVDSTQGLDEIRGASRLAVREWSHGVSDGNHIHSFEVQHNLAATQVDLRDYDFKRPTANLASRFGASTATGSATETPSLGIFRHRLGYEENDVTSELAMRHLQQVRRDAARQEGTSHCCRLRPGSRFSLTDHPAQHVDGDYYITEIRHRGTFGGTSATGSDVAPRYQNEFATVAKNVPFRPSLKTRPPAQVVETATVVGPASEEIYTDQHGRVKVQFHWDLKGERNEASSCWLRVAQPWAGTSWGFQFIPRVGMEVVVTFIGGDLDRPLITGSLFNAANPPSYITAAEATRSGIKTRSSPGGDGYNELSFDDRKGAEQVRLRAERNLDETVLVDHSTSVGNNQTQHIEANQTTLVGASQTIHVGGSRHLNVDGVEQTTVGLDRADTTKGDFTETVLGNSSSHVGGNSSASVIGSQLTSVNADHSLQIGGASTVQIGNELSPSGGDVYAFGDYAIGAGDTITLRAQKAIILQCGESSIELRPDEIRIASPKVRTVATDLASMQTRGPSIALTGQMDLAAKTLNLFGEESFLSLTRRATMKAEQVAVVGGGAGLGLSGTAVLTGQEVKLAAGAGATLILDANANLDGALVKLNCGGGGAGVGAEDVTHNPLEDHHVTETKPLKLRVLDAMLEPVRNKRYILAVGGERFDGTTSAEGQLEELKVPASADAGQLTVWPGEYPEGPRLSWAIKLNDELPPVESVRGARIRLSNLGYYNGPPIDEMDDELRRSIGRFQLDRELDVTRELDIPTIAALRETHGH